MSTPALTWEQRYHAVNRLLTQLAHSVQWMRQLQEEFQSGSNSLNSQVIVDAEKEVDELVKLHLLPPVPVQ